MIRGDGSMMKRWTESQVSLNEALSLYPHNNEGCFWVAIRHFLWRNAPYGSLSILGMHVPFLR